MTRRKLTPAEREARKTSVNKRSATYPGMTDKSSWRRTLVHRHTDWYGCALCGVKFADPTAVYTHLDKRHPNRNDAGASEASAEHGEAA